MQQQPNAAETQADFGTDPKGLVARYVTEIDLFEKERKSFFDRGDKIVKRYRDERAENEKDAKRFSLLWANVETQKPVLYSRIPKADVQRRFKDNDPVSRVAAEIAERVLDYAMDCDGRFDATVKACVEDYLLPGLAVSWQRYVPHMRTVTPQIPVLKQTPSDGVQVTNAGDLYAKPDGTPVDAAAVMDDGNGGFFIQGEPYQETEYEEVVDDYVHWKDFGHNPGARTWDEVYCVWRRVYMTRDEMVERFGEVGKKIPLDHVPAQLDKDKKEHEVFKKACVYELWDKSRKKVVWISKGYADAPLDERDDPLKLRDFFPCPKPLMATTTNNTLVVVPDYCQYQDQAQEIDDLTAKIGVLTKGLKVRGLYPGDMDEIRRMVTEADNLDLIPIKDWMSFAEKGGLEKAIAWWPTDMIAKALIQCYDARERAKQDAFEVTGISDILRGESDANETATAQSIKAQWGTTRISQKQKAVQTFIRDTLRIKFEIVFNLFSDETILAIVNPQAFGQDQQLIGPALQLLRDKALRHFRVDIETDSTVQPNEQAEKEARNEFLTAVGSFMTAALPVLQAAPQLAPMFGEMLMFGVRGYKVGSTLETAIEQGMAQVAQMAMQPPQGNPEADAKVEAIKAKTQAEIEAKMAKTQADIQAQQVREATRAQNDAVLTQAQAESMAQQPQVMQ